jgi:hypothetical protein
MTKEDQIIEERVRAFHIGEESPAASHLIYATEALVKGAHQLSSGQLVGGGVHEHHPRDLHE